VRVVSTQFPFARELSLILHDDNGTPGNFADDASVYFMSGVQAPQPAEGWRNATVSVPSAHSSMPAGWQVLDGSGTPDQIWNRVITNVRQVRWFFGDPTNFFIFDIWSVGADNARIERAQASNGYLCTSLSAGASCPCANPGEGLQGCDNSTGAGAVLELAGSTSVAADALTFSAFNLPPNTSALLFQGTASTAAATFGAGLRCAGGAITRLGVRTASASGSAVWGPGLAALGGWTPNTSRVFQAWYRNLAGPCSTFNLSSARLVDFAP
jgi:hypothetical protein